MTVSRPSASKYITHLLRKYNFAEITCSQTLKRVISQINPVHIQTFYQFMRVFEH